MVISKKREVGNLGEDLACRFLMKHDFKVVQRNYLRKCGEIDIIASKDGKIHFIEVKTVSTENVSGETLEHRAEDNIHHGKLERMRKVIQVYLNSKDISHGTTWVFDVVTVLLNREKKEAKIDFIENLII